LTTDYRRRTADYPSAAISVVRRPFQHWQLRLKTLRRP